MENICKNCGCELDKDGSHLDEVEEDGIKYCDNFKFIGFVNNTPERHFKQCCCTKPEPISYTDLAWREDGTSEVMVKTK